jgi:hypothetical protein
MYTTGFSMKGPMDWFSEGSGRESEPTLGPLSNSRILSLENKSKKIIFAVVGV